MNEASNNRTRVIAFYLPQYHPIPENNMWWGKGFTEWTNVARAKPLYRGHYQPRIPADLGFYDLRLPEVREEQAELAREAGVEGFCYWHYWFGNGNRVLERPFEEVLQSGKPDFPFCLAWANSNWTNKTWKKSPRFTKKTILMEQTYSEEDHIKHFNYLLGAFRDKRYITIDGKPLFLIYQPYLFPDVEKFITLWRRLAKENGLNGIYFIAEVFSASYRYFDDNGIEKISNLRLDTSGERYNNLLKKGFDGLSSINDTKSQVLALGRYSHILRRVLQKVFGNLKREYYDHRKINRHAFFEEDKWGNVYPTITPCLDDSPRRGKSGRIYLHSSPALFESHAKEAIRLVKDKKPDHRILFLRSWNEWGEGNYMEPDQKYGKGYIEALRRALDSR